MDWEYSKRYLQKSTKTYFIVAAIIGTVAAGYFFSEYSNPLIEFYCSSGHPVVFFSTNLACPLLLAVTYVLVLALVLVCFPLVVTGIADVSILAYKGVQNRPNPKAKIIFRTKRINEDIFLEIFNNERKLPLNDIQVEMIDIQSLDDRWGNPPKTEERYLDSWNDLLKRRRYENFLIWKEGGSRIAGLITVNPKASVLYYLFKIENGVFWWNTDRADKSAFCNFDEGKYRFALTTNGYVENRDSPNIIYVTVDYKGGDIIDTTIDGEDDE